MATFPGSSSEFESDPESSGWDTDASEGSGNEDIAEVLLDGKTTDVIFLFQPHDIFNNKEKIATIQTEDGLVHWVKESEENQFMKLTGKECLEVRENACKMEDPVVPITKCEQTLKTSNLSDCERVLDGLLCSTGCEALKQEDKKGGAKKDEQKKKAKEGKKKAAAKPAKKKEAKKQEPAKVETTKKEEPKEEDKKQEDKKQEVKKEEDKKEDENKEDKEEKDEKQTTKVVAAKKEEKKEVVKKDDPKKKEEPKKKVEKKKVEKPPPSKVQQKISVTSTKRKRPVAVVDTPEVTEKKVKTEKFDDLKMTCSIQLSNVSPKTALELFSFLQKN